MCFAYFRMNKYEKNDKKYIKEKCEFLLSRGYSMDFLRRNSERCFFFYVKDKKGKETNNSICLYEENAWVSCSYSNITTPRADIKTLNIDLPEQFDSFTDMEKIDFYINVVKNNIKIIDDREKIKNIIKKHIDSWDPIDLLSFCPPDEYDSEIQYIYDNLCHYYYDEKTLTRLIYNTFSLYFDDDFKKELIDCEHVAVAIYKDCKM